MTDARVEVRTPARVSKAVAAISQLTGREIPMNENPASRWALRRHLSRTRGVVLAVSALQSPAEFSHPSGDCHRGCGVPGPPQTLTATPLAAKRLIEALHQAGYPTPGSAALGPN